MLLTSTAISALLVGLAPLCAAVIYDEVSDLPSLDGYDYVIVGGGVAGSVVANRLTEDADVSVLVLEAGQSYVGAYEIEVPFYFWLGIPDRFNWNYTTVPLPNVNNRSIVYPRGHVMGGSSAINGMVYDRATIDDYDKLANVTGDSGWSWDNLLPYFIKMEHLLPPVDGHNTTGEFDPKAHGYSGPLGDSLYGYAQAIDQYVLDTLGSDVFPYNEDTNAGDEIGFGWQVSTIHNGIRTTAANAYLAEQYLQRQNLDVLVNAFVTRVLSSNGSAIDTVEFHQVAENSSTVHAKPTREVIMSAGSVNTPHILLNSGIGDNATLSALNITPVHHLPDVGKNMSDTLVLYITWEVDSNDTFDGLLQNDTARLEAFALWNETHTGRMANGVVNMEGSLRLNQSNPAVQQILAEYGDSTTGPTAGDFEMLFIDGGLDNAPNGSFFSMLVGVTAPMSRGSVTLNASDPLGPPLFDPGYLTSQYDLLVMRQALITAFQFVSTPPWTSYLKTPINGLGAVLDTYKSGNYTAMDELIRNSIQNGAHIVGTSSMSPYGADYGVTDPDLKVKGLAGLRVVDASVFPFIPGGATQIPTYGMSERASDVIKQSWK